MTLVRLLRRQLSSSAAPKFEINGEVFERDEFTNVTDKLRHFINKNIYLADGHPLFLIRQRIINYFHDNFKGRTGNSYFSVHERLNPIVTIYQNFNSLLVPKDHDSRKKSNCYYINKELLLRSHMTAHQSELIRMGLNSFLMIGDVYRRDSIDPRHYPIFHQVDGVRLFTPEEVFAKDDDGTKELRIKKNGGENQLRTNDCQEMYTSEASRKIEEDLKKTLVGLTKALFGPDINFKWSSSSFPFTHPSWELEIEMNGQLIEVLGCGIIEYKILREAGCDSRIGWAFGMGLERLAMILYQIPDIRLFWSKDSGFLHQFRNKSFSDNIVYKSLSRFPQCKNDISFWISETFSNEDFYDLVRDIAGDLAEQIHLIDVYKNPKNGRVSHCYQIVYRHMEKTFTKEEVNKIHCQIENAVEKRLKCEVR